MVTKKGKNLPLLSFSPFPFQTTKKQKDVLHKAASKILSINYKGNNFFFPCIARQTDWTRKCFKDLMQNHSSKQFFVDRRQLDNCMWIRKTKNKSKTGNTAEIFRIDNKERKCSIFVLEGSDKKRLADFPVFHYFHIRLGSKETKINIQRSP